MAKKESDGIIRLGTFIMVISALAIFVICICYLYMHFLEGERGEIDIILPIYLIFPICFLIASNGLLKLKKWGRKLAIITASIWLLIIVPLSIEGLIKDIKERGVNIIEEVFMRAIFLWLPFVFIIYYLTRPKVKEQFR